MRGSNDAVVTDEELLLCVIWGNQNGSKTAKSHRATVSEVLLEKMATVSMQTQKIPSSQLVIGRNSSKQDQMYNILHQQDRSKFVSWGILLAALLAVLHPNCLA